MVLFTNKIVSLTVFLSIIATRTTTANGFASLSTLAKKNKNLSTFNNNRIYNHHKQRASSSSTTSLSLSSPTSGIIGKLRGGGNDSSSDSVSGTGTATIPNEVFNLVKGIVGSGVLSLPWGVAIFGSKPSALIPATLLIGLMGTISGYTFGLIGRVCQKTNSNSYAEAWDKTVGPRLSFIIAFSCFFDCFAGNLSYSMILADTFKTLLSTIGISVTRTASLLGVTGGFLLPLCLLKNLSSLAPVSLVGLLGMLYTMIAMAVRYFGKAYKVGGQFFIEEGLPTPTFGTVAGVGGASAALSPKALILTCMLSNAYIAHFNAPKFLKELKNNTMQRFHQVIGWSFGTSAIVYSIVTALGFLTFGTVSDGLILNNYSAKDTWMVVSRIAIALSIIGSYPLLFVGQRDGLMDLLKVNDEKRNDNNYLNKLTLIMLAITTFAAMKLTDLGLVASIGGATFGTALVFIYPTIMFIKSQTNKETGGGKTGETKVAALIAAIGVIMSVVGTILSFQE